MRETHTDMLTMYSTLIVAVAMVSASSACPSRKATECPCYTYGLYVNHMICADPSLIHIPPCVPSNITTLAIRTPSIHLIPRNIRRFTKLQRLYLEHFDDIHFSKNFFKGMPKISVLKIYGTNLNKVEREWFKHTPDMRMLIFSYNKISVLDPHVFSSLKKLDTVALDHNKLTTLPPLLFEGTALKELYIEENPFICNCELPTFIQWTRENEVEIMEQVFCIHPLLKKRVDLITYSHDENCLS